MKGQGSVDVDGATLEETIAALRLHWTRAQPEERGAPMQAGKATWVLALAMSCGCTTAHPKPRAAERVSAEIGIRLARSWRRLRMRGPKRCAFRVLVFALAALCRLGTAFAAPFAYIVNADSNNVSVIDVATNTVVKVLTLLPPLSNPIGVGTIVGGTRAYVTDIFKVRVIDTTTNTLISSVSVGVNPSGVAVSPDGTRVYVANRSSNTVSVIDAANNAVVATVPVGSTPLGVAVNPSGTRVYVTNNGSRTVSAIDTATNAVIATVPVGAGCVGVNAFGTRVYVTNALDNTVSVIDATANAVVATIPVEIDPGWLAGDPAGTRVYVANSGSADVSVIDTLSNTVVASVAVNSRPTGVSVNSDGTRVYVTNSGSNNVSVIDTTSNTVVATIAVGKSPVSFGLFIGGGSPLPPASPIPMLGTFGLTVLTLLLAVAAFILMKRSIGEKESLQTSPPAPRSPANQPASALARLRRRAARDR